MSHLIEFAAADAELDLRATGVLLSSQSTHRYALRVSDCSTVVAARVLSDQGLQEFPRPPSAGAGPCEFEFDIPGLAPSVSVRFEDGSELSHAEVFQIEDVPPTLSFEGVERVESNGEQYLRVTLRADDDTDLAGVSISAIGLRASALRASGGVVERARGMAFADTNGPVRLVPQRDGQTIYEVVALVSQPLSDSEWAQDGLVLIEGSAIDAFGNEASISKLALTGSEVSERALGLSLRPERLTLTNLLASEEIVATVNFQFRGHTQLLVAAGSGVSFTSSHPELVGVTPDGVVYPLAETGNESVTITASFPNTEPRAGEPSAWTATIPVVVNDDISVVGLRASPLDPSGALVVPRLNAMQPLPDVYAVFSDGTEAQVRTQFPTTFVVPAAWEGVLGIVAGRLVGLAPTSEATPAVLEFRIQSVGLSGTVPVRVVDAAPSATVQVAATAVVGDRLSITALANDDVGVERVRFFLDGEELATRRQPPFRLDLDMSSNLGGQTLSFEVEATDTRGQTSRSQPATTLVYASAPQVPTPTITSPRQLQSFVEGSTIDLIATSDASGERGSTDANYVEFFSDDALIAIARSPEHSIGPNGEPIVIWRATARVESISTGSASRAIYALAHGGGGGTARSEPVLYRVRSNAPPTVAIISPQNLTAVTPGQTVPVAVQVGDDDFAAGVAVELLANERVVLTQHLRPSVGTVGQGGLGADTASFMLPIGALRPGQSLRVTARATDSRGLVADTPLLQLVAQSDQPPTVAVAHPIQGSHHVSGTIVELRANAADDLGVNRVEFYVQDQLVISDASPPFAYLFKTPDGLDQEQVFSVHTVAYDNAGQSARSAKVEFTLGNDEFPPVVNVVSPRVSRTTAGVDFAEVVESTQAVFRVSGFDNVAATRVEVRGLRRGVDAYIPTGNVSDVLTGSDVGITPIPGQLNAFTIVRLLQLPAYSGANALGYDPFPIEVEAWDQAGNSTIARLTLAVLSDTVPEVDHLTTERGVYFVHETVGVLARASDDVGVAELRLQAFLDGSSSPFLTRTSPISPPEEATQHRFELDLAGAGVSNASHSIQVRVVAVDGRGARSEEDAPTATYSFTVQADTSGPAASVSSPIPGTTLYGSSQVQVGWRATDESLVSRVTVREGTHVIFTATPAERTASGSFAYTVPTGRQEITLSITAEDVHGQQSTQSVRYPVVVDGAPRVRVLSPPAGIRLLEGEPFTLVAEVADDREVGAVTFFVADATRDLTAIPATNVPATMAAGGRFTQLMRVPHRPEGGGLRIGVRARDGAGHETEGLAEIEILDDFESPVVELQRPTSDLEARVSAAIDLSGHLEDNQWIEGIHAIVEGLGGQRTTLEWASLVRNDRVEQRVVPNPNSFGSQLVATRFVTDFRGQALIPTDGLEIGATYDLFIEAFDSGRNVVASRRLRLTIRGDESPPVITVQSPVATVVEGQPNFVASITVTDDLLLESFRVVHSDGRTLATRSGINQPSTAASFAFPIPTLTNGPQSLEFTVFA